MNDSDMPPDELVGRYAGITSAQVRGVIKFTIEFEMAQDRNLLALVGNRLPDAENPIFLKVSRADNP